MKVSLITVTYNAARYLPDCLHSVQAQDYPDLEHWVIDGGSTDNTVALLKAQGEKVKWISEKDQGLYDAMNKGLSRVSGDIIGILNADDFYAHTGVISAVVAEMERTGADTLFGDLVFVDPEQITQVRRYFPGVGFQPSWFLSGKMPPHPTFFVRKAVYDQVGGFDTRFRIVADFDLMTRILRVNKKSWAYLPQVLVHMRAGGVSTSGVSATLRINQEMRQSLKKQGLPASYLRLYGRYLTKIAQLWKRPEDRV